MPQAQLSSFHIQQHNSQFSRSCVPFCRHSLNNNIIFLSLNLNCLLDDTRVSRVFSSTRFASALNMYKKITFPFCYLTHQSHTWMSWALCGLSEWKFYSVLLNWSEVEPWAKHDARESEKKLASPQTTDIGRIYKHCTWTTLNIYNEWNSHTYNVNACRAQTMKVLSQLTILWIYFFQFRSTLMIIVHIIWSDK